MPRRLDGIMVGVVALILGVVLLRWAPPTARGEDAPPDIFAAGGR